MFEEKDQGVQQKELELDVFYYMIHNFISKSEEKRTYHDKNLWALQEERVILNNQLHDIGDDDLIEAIIYNVLGHLEYLVPDLQDFYDYFSLI